MSGLPDQVESLLVEKRLLADGESFLVAVSGGVDSMVLLHILHEKAAAHDWRLAVAHFNHRLRGQSSRADEEFVRRAATNIGVKFKAGRADVKRFAARRGLSIEMAARQLRHEFFAKTADSLGVHKVALAHHADDQVELFFLRLLRGSGPEGLSGMQDISPSPADPNLRLVRPLLNVTHNAIVEFARERGIRFRLDRTNELLDYERNRVRHELLPFLRGKFNPALDRTVLRLMSILSAESGFLDQNTREIQRENVPDWDTLHVALQRRHLRSECLRLGIVPDFDLIETLRSRRGQEVMVQPGRVVWRDPFGRLQAVSVSKPKFKPGRKTVGLSAPTGKANFDGVEVAWSTRPWRGWRGLAKRTVAGTERFDAGKVGPTIHLRHWRPGDRFQPIGMESAIKLQDLFTNQKIDRARRVELVVAETVRGEIFWTEDLRISERFKIDEATTRVLEWTWKRLKTGNERLS